MGGSVKGKGGRNGNKTHGRNKEWCNAYKLRNQREKNKKQRLMCHVRNGHANDKAALAALLALGVKPETFLQAA